jgi:hypothetical protein
MLAQGSRDAALDPLTEHDPRIDFPLVQLVRSTPTGAKPATWHVISPDGDTITTHNSETWAVQAAVLYAAIARCDPDWRRCVPTGTRLR